MSAGPQPVAMMTYPIPLHRPGGIVFARAVLPADLTQEEAERIGAYIRAFLLMQRPLAEWDQALLKWVEESIP
jgi:hypothetical protein